MKKAYSMIELIFVIAIIGILASIAAPKLFATRTDAIIAKVKTDIASIKTGIELKHSADMINGSMSYPASLHDATLGGCFSAVLKQPIVQVSVNGWTDCSTGTPDATGELTIAKANIDKVQTQFYYNKNNGNFYCKNTTSDAKSNKLCDTLTK